MSTTTTTTTTETHTVKHISGAYLVRDSDGFEVARYAYDLDDFQTRRAAYREALEDAGLRNDVAAEQAAVAEVEAEVQAEIAAQLAEHVARDIAATRAQRRWNEVQGRAWQTDFSRLNAQLDARETALIAELLVLGYTVETRGAGEGEAWRVVPVASEPGPSIPGDCAAEDCPSCDRSFWRSSNSGRCFDLLSGRQIFVCPCGRDLTPHLSNGTPWPIPPDDDDPDPTSPAPGARVVWTWAGTADALRQLIAQRTRVLRHQDWAALSHPQRIAHLARLTPAEIGQQARVRARIRGVPVAQVLADWSRNGMITSRQRRAAEQTSGTRPAA